MKEEFIFLTFSSCQNHCKRFYLLLMSFNSEYICYVLTPVRMHVQLRWFLRAKNFLNTLNYWRTKSIIFYIRAAWVSNFVIMSSTKTWAAFTNQTLGYSNSDTPQSQYNCTFGIKKQTQIQFYSFWKAWADDSVLVP